jgi:nitrate/nitrite transport system substrate-binding protein
MWKDHPEKVCAFTEKFATENPKTVRAVLRALYEASVWLDDLKNRPQAAEIVSRPTYINCSPDAILARLLGDYDYGDGRKKKDEHYMIFHERGCNYPQPKFGTWWMTQLERWGMTPPIQDYAEPTSKVLRPDIYEQVMKELGVATAGRDDSPVTLFDGKTFDPSNAAEYARSFAIHSRKA